MVFNRLTKVLILPLYYLLHHNFIVGLIQKFLIKNFYYKDFTFFLNIKNIPLPNYSSFFFKTYEYNDRKLIERNITRKNKCIVIGGGIGFIPCLTYKISGNKLIIFEINYDLISNLNKNLISNNCKFKLYNENLVIFKSEKRKKFYLTKDFLATSSRIMTNKFIKIKNLYFKKIKNFKKFNTLIIDAEGDEQYYTKNIKYLKNIKHLYFELHHNIFGKKDVEKIMKDLKKNNFEIKDKCFNSFYFRRKI